MTKQFANVSAITTMISLCLDIHNKGIATVFINIYGHVDQSLDIHFHVPFWNKELPIPVYVIGVHMMLESYDHAKVAGLITKLNEVLMTGQFPENFGDAT